jgi:hypothetical protein
MIWTLAARVWDTRFARPVDGGRAGLFKSFGLRPKDEPAALPPIPPGNFLCAVLIGKNRTQHEIVVVNPEPEAP